MPIAYIRIVYDVQLKWVNNIEINSFIISYVLYAFALIYYSLCSDNICLCVHTTHAHVSYF